MSRGRLRLHVHRAALGLVLVGCGASPHTGEEPQEPAITVPQGFPAFTSPADNEPTRDRIELGRRLFYDERLSRTQEVSCSSCHVQRHAFADPRRVSSGVEGRVGSRNALALVNLAWGKSFFWHGGVASLEVQAVAPIKDPAEMDTTLGEVVTRLQADAELVRHFERAYDEGPSETSITRALASFVRSLVSGSSPYDRWIAGEQDALDDAAKRGERLFNGERGECFHCHTGYNFTNNAFRNNGGAPGDPDVGRSEITLKDSDAGKFKVPTLRNVAVSAPYMHDGALATLAEVIDAYAAGGRGHPNTDPTIRALNLNARDKLDLVAFLEALTDQDFLENPAFADPEP